ncbi:MAG: hypothetical protein HQK76_20230 [Desulfobacterales bacterium]|nr:hypothetical protein [Desulfobacterales bacterium]
MKKILVIVLGIFVLCFGTAYAVEVGDTVENINLKDAEDKPSQIPFFGEKVLSIIYADPEASDMNDPLADALKAKNFDIEKYKGIGIANMKDTWKPNSIIRMVVRKKIEKYKSTILTDPDRTFPKQWSLGDCDDVSVVVIIGKDKKVKYLKKGEVTKDEIPNVISLIEQLMNQ